MATSTRPDRTTLTGHDLGLLVLRVVAGLAMATHGVQKLFGWFGGLGVDGNAAFFASIGYPADTFFSVLTGVVELVAGLMLAAGLATPLAGAAFIGIMLNAVVTYHLDAGFWNTAGDRALLYAAAGAALAFTGPGRLSADAGRPWAQGGLTYGVAAVGLGVAAAVPVLIIWGLA